MHAYDDGFLFCTTLPVLLDGKGTAGHLALTLYRKYALTPHWFGHGYHLLLSVYAEKHVMPLPFAACSDTYLTRMLCDFAQSPETSGFLLVLIPCSPKAEAYVVRAADKLESAFVLHTPPKNAPDPLQGLVRSGHI